MKVHSLILIVFSVALAGIAFTLYEPVVQAGGTDRIAHWRFDDGAGLTATDSSGLGNDALLVGPSWTAGGPDGSPFALSFDGVDDYVDGGNLDVSGTGITLACWIKADDFGIADARLISKATGVAADDHFWMLSTISSGGDMRIRFRVRAGGSTGTLVASAGNLSAGVWYHVAGVYDGSTMRIYVDGVDVGSTSKNGTLAVDRSVAVAVGDQPPGAGDRNFDGCIDEVRIYTRALSAMEVDQLANDMVPNVAPVAVDDSYAVDAGQVLNVAANQGVLDNDTDSNGDALVATLLAGTTQGTLNLNADGSFDYTPNAGFIGNDTFTYQADDTQALSNVATVTITVNPVPPVAVDDTAVVDPQMSVAIPVLQNDSDGDGTIDATTVLVTTAPTLGTTSVDPMTGVVTYTHTATGGGVDSFVYTVQDDDGATSNPATVTVEIGPQLVTNGLVLHLEVDSGVMATGIDVTGWLDQSPQGNDLVASNVPIILPAELGGFDVIHFDGNNDHLERTPPLNGFPSGNADRTVIMLVRYLSSGTGGFGWGTNFCNEAFQIIAFPPDGNLMLAGWCGANSFPTATPGFGAGWILHSARLQSDNYTHYRDGTVIDSGTHVFATTTAFMALGAEVNGSSHVEMDVAAVLVYDRALSDVERAQSEDYLSLKYFGSSAPNSAPVANADFGSVQTNGSVAIDILDNDTDDGALDPLTVSLVDMPTQGTVTFAPNGVATYTHTSGTGTLDTFTYTVDDTEGATSNVATVTVQISTSACPLIQSGLVLHLETDFGISTAGGFVSEWLDQSGQGNHLTGSGEPTVLAGALNGEDAIRFDGNTALLERTSGTSGLPLGNSDRTVFFVVNYQDNAAGGFGYGVNFCNEAFQLLVSPSTSTLTLTAWCSEHTFVSQEPGVGQGWMIQSVKVDGGKFTHSRDGIPIDAGNRTFATVDGRLVVGGEVNGTSLAEIDTAAVLVYDRALNQAECDQIHDYLLEKYFGYPCGDGPPVARDDFDTVELGQSVAIDVLANDFDGGMIDATTVTMQTMPSHGTVAIDSVTGVITYQHAGSSLQTDSFTYTVRDNVGQTSNVAMVYIAIDDVSCVLPTAGLVLHLDASEGVDTQGNVVDQWNDLSGSGNHVTPNMGYPFWVANSLGGRPAVSFDGNDDCLGRDMLTGFPQGSADRSVFLVVDYLAGNAGLTWGNSSCNEAFGPIVDGSGNLTVQGWCPENDYISSTAGVGAGPMVHGVIVSSNNVLHYSDDSIIDMPTQVYATADGILRIGAELDGSPTAQMVLSEALVYDRAVSEAERVQIMRYLRGRYFGQPCNSPPVGVNDAYTVVQGGGNLVVDAVSGVLANDTDADGNLLTASLITDVSNGTLTFNPDGSFIYVPTLQVDDSFTYQASDGFAVSNIVTVNLTVASPPVAGLEAHYPFDEGVGNIATDITGNGNNGTLVGPAYQANSGDNSPFYLQFDGVDDYVDIGSLDISGSELTIACWVRPDGFGISDARVLSKATGTSTNAHFWMLGTVTSGGEPVLRARLRTGGTTNTIIAGSSPFVAGTWAHIAMVYDGTEVRLYKDGVEVGSDNQAGALATDPAVAAVIGNQPPGAGDKAFDGCIDDVRFYSDALTVPEIQALAAGIPQNQPPVAVLDDYTMDPNTVLSTDALTGVLNNDSDPDGDNFTALLIAGPSNGSLVLNADGSFTYTPNLNFANAADSFTYQAMDASGVSNTAQVTINVNPIPGVPTAVNDAYGINEGETLVRDALTGVLANDTDPDLDPLTAVLVNNVTQGTLALAPDGSFTYTPNAGFTGADTFTYVADDGNIPSNEATVTITVAVIPPPVAVNDDYMTNADTLLVVPSMLGVLANDTDPQGDPLTTQLMVDVSNGILALAPDGSFTYTPNAGFVGTDSFQYVATDGTKSSNVATASIEVLPFLTDGLKGYYRFEEGSGTTATDSSGDNNNAVLAGPQYVMNTPDNSVYSLSFDGVNDLVDLGNFEFGGTELTIALWFKADTFNVADARLISRASSTASGDHFWMLSTVPSGGDTKLRARLRTNGDTETLIADTAVITTGVWIHTAMVYDGSTLRLYQDGVEVASLGQTGSIDLDRLVQAAIGNQPAGDKPFDGCIDEVRIYCRALSVPEVQTLAAFVPPNAAPVAVDDSYIADANMTLSVPASGVLGNDTDAENDPLSAMLVTGPTNGMLAFNADGSFDYTPNANFGGASDSFTYVATDGNDTSNVATVTIDVNPIPGVPVALPDAYSVDEGNALNVVALSGVLSNDNDPDMDPLTAVLGADVSNGMLTLNPDGSFDYVPNNGFSGVDSFTYQADDGNLPSALVTVTITVNFIAPPVAVDDTYATETDQVLSINALIGVLGNDSDPQMDPLTAQLLANVSNGALNLAADGSFVYTPNVGFAGVDQFSYQATDGTKVSNMAVVTINVNPPAGSGLKGYYRFEEASGTIATDSSGSGNDGLIAGPTYLLDSPAGGQYVLNFDGVDDYVDLGALDVPGTELTLSLWFNADSFGISDARLLSKATGTSSGAHYWMISTVPTDGEMRLRARLMTDGTTETLVASSGALTTGVWVHVAVVYDGSNLRLYKDGVEVGSIAQTGALDTSAAVLAAIGNQPPGAGDKSFDGLIDEVRIYCRALDTMEIQTLASGVPMNQPPTAVPDSYVLDADTTLNVNAAMGVLANDFDPDSDPFSAVLATSVTNGVLVFNPDGSFDYTPNMGFAGEDSFTYFAMSATGDSNVTTVTLTVAPDLITAGLVLHLESDFGLNVAPDGVIQSWLDQSLAGNHVTGFGDPMVAAGALNGMDVVQVDGNNDRFERSIGITGLPTGNADRTMIFLVQYLDSGPGGLGYGTNFCNEAFQIINRPRDGSLMLAGWCGANSFGTTAEGQGAGWIIQAVRLQSDTYTHYKNDQVIDSGTHVFNTVISTLNVGTEVNSNSDATMDIAAALIYDRALSDAELELVRTYLEGKYLGGSTPNQAPVADADFGTVSTGGSTVIDVLDGDTDDGAIDATSVQIVSNPSFGTVSVNPGTGAVTYSHGGGPETSDSFTYTVRDNLGVVSNVATVTVQISDSPCPLVTTGLVLHLESDFGVTLNGSNFVQQWADQSAQGNDLSGIGEPSILSGELNGRDAIRLDGNISYFQQLAPTALPLGNSDRTLLMLVRYNGNGPGGLGYGINFCNEAFELLVAPPGGGLGIAGWCGDNTFLTKEPGAGAGWIVQSVKLDADTFSQYKNDILFDQGDHVFNTVAGPLILGGEINAPNNLVAMDVGAVLVYDRALTPAEHEQVVDYLLDKYLGYTCGDSPPVADNDFAEVTFEGMVAVDVLNGDVDEGAVDPTTVVMQSGPSNGSVSINSSTGVMTYTHNGGNLAPDSFTYTVQDDSGQTSNTATVYIAVDSGCSLSQTSGLVLHLDSSRGVSKTGPIVDQWDDQSSSGYDVLGTSGSVHVRYDALDGRPAICFDGKDDSLGRAAVGNFSSGSADRTMIFVANYLGGNGGVSYGSPACNEAFGGIVNGAGDLTVQGWCPENDFISTEPGVGAGWLIQSIVLDSDTLTHFKDGVLIDTQSHTFDTTTTMLRLGIELNGANAAQLELVEVLIYDRALSTAQRQSVENYLGGKYFGQSCMNVPPVAIDDAYGVAENTPLVVAASIGVLSNDTDVESDPLTATLVSNVSNGSLALNNDGSFTYTPTNNFLGTDSFTYEAADSLGTSNVATVTITVSPPSIEAQWEFDEGAGTVASDSSGNGNNASLVGTFWSTDTPDGSAFSMETNGGSNELVDIGNMDVSGNAMTLSMWIKADDFDIQDARLISKATSTASGDHYWMLSMLRVSGENRIRFRLMTNGDTDTLIASSGDIAADTWYHVAGVYDGSTMRIYVDGVEVGSVAKTGSIDTNAAVAAAIGNQPSGAGDKGFDGKIDSVQIFSRALSQGEINALAGN